MVSLEFAHYDYKLRGTISAKDFALSMVASADMKHLNKLLDRVDELNGSNLSDLRITFEEFKNFAELRKRLHPFSIALFSYGKANGLLTRKDFQRAASQVCYSFVLFLLVLPLTFLQLLILKMVNRNVDDISIPIMWTQEPINYSLMVS